MRQARRFVMFVSEVAGLPTARMMPRRCRENHSNAMRRADEKTEALPPPLSKI
jgi:hypothetical protein